MKKLLFHGTMALAVLVAAGACGTKNPAGGSSTLTAPTGQTPAQGAKYLYAQQPITLTIKNAVTTGTNPLTYTFEVASDAAFATKVAVSDGVAAGSGTTSVTLGAKLAGGNGYYWRARANDGATPGLYSTAINFSIGAMVVIDAPVQEQPADGANIAGTRPLFVIDNSTRTGPAGAIAYRFDIADNQGFNPILMSSSLQQEQAGTTQTSWAPTSDLPVGKMLYWRAVATDTTNNVSSAYSKTRIFSVSAFDPTRTIFINNPPINTWAETAKITRVDFSDGFVVVDFDKRDGPNRWPDVPFGSGTVEYTLGMCANLSGQWYCSAVIQFWYGRELEAGGRMDEIGINWYFDQRWRQLEGWQPKIGELVGIFVAAGNLRDSNNWKVEERSNILLIPYGTNYNW